MSCSYYANSGDLELPITVDKNSADCESQCFSSCSYNNMDSVQQDILLEDCNEACMSSGGEVTYTGEDLYAMHCSRLAFTTPEEIPDCCQGMCISLSNSNNLQQCTAECSAFSPLAEKPTTTDETTTDETTTDGTTTDETTTDETTTDGTTTDETTTDDTTTDGTTTDGTTTDETTTDDTTTDETTTDYTNCMDLTDCISPDCTCENNVPSVWTPQFQAWFVGVMEKVIFHKLQNDPDLNSLESDTLTKYSTEVTACLLDKAIQIPPLEIKNEWDGWIVSCIKELEDNYNITTNTTENVLFIAAASAAATSTGVIEDEEPSNSHTTTIIIVVVVILVLIGLGYLAKQRGMF